MNRFLFKHPESPVTYEFWFLSKDDRKGWAPREDGSFRYYSSGLGTVIIEKQPGNWSWREYNANDPEVSRYLAHMFTEGPITCSTAGESELWMGTRYESTEVPG